jgi:hypothetical protein
MNLDRIFGGQDATPHKVFISYYHEDDHLYRLRFELLFRHLFINKSVKPGDIDSDTGDEYIKRLIREGYITDASILVVLVGPDTHTRKHVDWEISAALNKKVGGYSGLVGLRLPSHPDYGKKTYNGANIPPRLVDNLVSGYANLYDWTDDGEATRLRIERAFRDRVQKAELIDNSLDQFRYNRTQHGLNQDLLRFLLERPGLYK